ncbi:MAG TPA: MBL fold metallo-hydrolase [Rubrivivax sp.]|nr:MBL fold metallo-hydrolase [Rubrivivax sp.]
MAEGIDADASRPKLEYPYPEPPARGQSLEVAPGVRWIRMPLPYTLNHINLWALDDGDGWALVDTGARTDEAALVWRELFAQAPDARGMTRVFVTHMHPDHVGLAGWLTRKFGVRLWMTQLEYLYCRAMVADTGREAPDDALHFYRRAGWSEIAIENYRARFGNFGKHVHTLPDSFRRLRDGDWLPIGAHRWQVIVGRGHSPEHACLYCPDLKLLISGDQVLPRISSNVSVHPTEPDADPMSDWLASLDRLQALVPDDVLLFRYSALTFNGHRIHYDRRYVTEVEGYPGLVVHGPLIATLLMDLLRRQAPEADVASFRFKAVRPTFDGRPLRVNGARDGHTVRLWAQDHEGWLTMDASATLR